MKNLRDIGIYVGLLVCSLLFTIAFMACSSKAEADCNYQYEMPTGSICDWKFESSKRVKFEGCDDGRVYYNPDFYREIKGKGCK